jgi:glycosyltransferase involved in cell wall biosynthesis
MGEYSARPCSKISVLGQKRIAFWTDDHSQGGVATYVDAMSCALARMGLDVTVVQSHVDGPRQATQRELGVKHHWLPYDTRKDANRTANNRQDAEEAYAAIRPDVLVFANCDPASHIAAKSVAIGQGIPYIVVEGYAYAVQEPAPAYARCIQIATEHYRQAKAVIAVSDDNLNLLHTYFGLPPGKGEVIHYGRPEVFFRPADPAVRASQRCELGIDSQDVLCLTVGRLEHVKGYDCLLVAVKELQRMPVWKHLHFVWIGGGDLEQEIRGWLEKMVISDHVHMLGQQPDVIPWYDASDLFILPSRFEGMPIAIMEAMAKGLPVVASAVGGIPEELGPTGRQLTSPLSDAAATVTEIVSTLEAWASDPALRRSAGQASQARAREMFREDRMVDQTLSVIERALLPRGDYVSPGLLCVRPDDCFPNMVPANPQGHPWPYLRSEIPHNWYQDSRAPGTGFANRDEAQILFNTALRFRGKRALEIGGWLGWSACHLALGGVLLDVIDPVLARPDFLRSVQNSLQAAGVLDRVNLVGTASPDGVKDLAESLNRRWSLFFVDGEHEGFAPVIDAAMCADFAEPDALVLFHDLASPAVARGLEFLGRLGWNTVIYSTMQIMAAAWRGNVQPVVHYPDPNIAWTIPDHLRGCRVSGT